MIDLVIIGGGPAGYVAAERASAKGLKVVLYESRALGGVCLNEGCMPTKTLLHSAKLYDDARDGERYGVGAEEVTYDFKKIIGRKDRIVRRLVGGIGVKMREGGVEVVKGHAQIKGRDANGVWIECEGVERLAKNVLIATGSRAFVPPIPGVKEATEAEIVITNREILSLKEQPKSLTVIGGGVIGLEFASFYASLGSQVTVVEMLPEILTGIDSEISLAVRDIYSKKGIVFNLSCKVTAIEGNDVVFTDSEGGVSRVSSEKILISVGRRAVVDGIGLESIGVELERGAIKVDSKMRTNVEGVFAAGDVTGISMLAHTASRQGEVVVNNLTGIEDNMNYNAIPSVVYLNPEIASVGLTMESARTKKISCRELKLPMAFAGRYMVENDAGGGLCKVVIGDKGEILGVHMLGNPSSEMIFGAAIAIEQGMTVAQLERVIFPHPTISEILKEVIFTA